MGGTAISADYISYTGDNTRTIRPMSIVFRNRLKEGDTFYSKEILQLRIAEEANLLKLQIYWARSHASLLQAVGEKFWVSANLHEKKGWSVKTLTIDDGAGNGGVGLEMMQDSDVEDSGEEEEDDISDNDEPTNEDSKGKKNILRTPFKGKWLVPLIKPIITEKPGCLNKDLVYVLQLYCRKYSLTRSILNSTRKIAREEIFGKLKENTKFMFALQEELENKGHYVELILSRRQEALCKLMMTVLAEERQHNENDNKKNKLSNPSDAAMFLKT